MIEVKFRAWHIPTAAWHYWTLQELAENLVVASDYEHWGQFTNYRDKEGQEIYEGDVVKRDRTGVKFSIRWSDRGWSIGWNIQASGKIKVIGDRYRNPELLPV